MTIPGTLLEAILIEPAEVAWRAMFAHAWDTCSAPLPLKASEKEIIVRDRGLAALDLALAASSWDLWADFEQSVEQTSTALKNWWANQPEGKAVLILDGLSLREAPWIIYGAKERGLQVTARVTGAELPGETTAFAKALGFGQRSDLENNRASQTHTLSGAKTDCVNLPWADCAELIGFDRDWVLWHQWPDTRIHEFADPGKGLAALATEAANQLTSDGFWHLVERLLQGRELVITSDHGYAASGLFPDVPEVQAKYLKTVFRSGRYADDMADSGSWLPPIDLRLSSGHRARRYVLGRRKWKSAGGYPTLTHGGLSVLEMACPFIELSRVSALSV
jgi:hypothetical protein